MSALVSVYVDGFAAPLPAHGEYTAAEVAALYQQQMTGIVEVFNKTKLLDATDPNLGTPNFIDNPSDLTQTDVTTVQNNLAALKDLAQNGLNVGGRTFYLTIEMARSIDAISKSLKAAGFDASPGIETLKQWQDFTEVGLREIILSALNAVSSNRSLQAMIELEYVKTGNQVLGEQLSDLKEALTITKEVLQTLEQVQILHNKIRPEARELGAFEEFISGNPVAQTLKETVYQTNRVTSDDDGTFVTFFDTSHETLKPTAIDDAGVYESFYVEAGDSAFKNLIPVVDDNPDSETIEALSPQTIQQFQEMKAKLGEHIAALEQLGISAEEEGSLANRLRRILDDMQNPIGGGTTIEEQIENWILDAQQFPEEDSRSIDSGNIQRRLTEGITSAESLNDQQKEDLRRFLFVFEEFYKSASSMLAAINRMIEKMAQGIKS